MHLGVGGRVDGLPARYLLTFDGTFDGGGSLANGVCHLEVDNTEIVGTKTSVHTPGGIQGFGINIVTTPQGGQHTFSVACNETIGDLKVPQFELSAIQVR